jgi:hypothetical protein
MLPECYSDDINYYLEHNMPKRSEDLAAKLYYNLEELLDSFLL